MRIFVSIPAVVFLLGLLPLVVPAQSTITPKNSRLAPIRAELAKKALDKIVPSISVGLLQNGKIVWRESFGYADVEGKIAATPETVYALGSLSKSITGTAVFNLVQDGKIDINKPINTYLRSVSIDHHGRDPNGYKVYHLLNMAAGVPHYWRYCYAESGSLDACADERFAAASFSAFAPAETHIYSNQSFGLAARMVADVSGMPFSEYLASQILRPAGMKSTFTHLNHVPRKSLEIAWPYNSDGARAPELQFEPSGGGGFWSSVADLLRYGVLHLPSSNDRKAILKNITLAENHTVRKDLPHGYYANGWGVLPLPNNGRTLLSNGAIEGAASTLLVLPEARAVIVVLVNKTVGNEFTDDIAFRIADAILPGYKGDLDKLFEQLGPLFDGKPFSTIESLNGVYNGRIQIGSKDEVVRVDVNEGRISIKIGDSPAKELKNVSILSGTITGQFQDDLSDAKTPREATVTFRSTGRDLTGFVSIEILKPRPEYLIAYYFSATKDR